MLKQDATWEQIQKTWDRMSHNQKAIVAARFDRNLKKSRPVIYAKLTNERRQFDTRTGNGQQFDTIEKDSTL